MMILAAELFSFQGVSVYFFLAGRRNNFLHFITKFIQLLKSYLFVEVSPFSYQIHSSAGLLTMCSEPIAFIPAAQPAS